jgi:hypothetical protein
MKTHQQIAKLVETAKTHADAWMRGYAIESLRNLTGAADWRTRQLANLALVNLSK